MDKKYMKLLLIIETCIFQAYDTTRKRELDGFMDAVKAYGLDEGIILTEAMEEEFDIEGVRIYLKPV